MRSMDRGEGLKRLAILLVLTGFLLYVPTYFHGFFADDHIYISFKNTLLRETGWSEWYRLFWERANPWEYLPLRDLSYWLDFRLYGIEGPGFHATQLVWYALSGAAAWLLIHEIVNHCPAQQNFAPNVLAWCGLALFIVHPVHVEAVAWVASRKDLMAATFAFLSCFALLRAVRQGWKAGGFILAALLLTLACFSKAAAVTMGGVELVLLLSVWHKSDAVPPWRKLIPLIAVGAAIALSIAVHMSVGADTGIRIDNAPGWWAVLERASRIQATLLYLLIWPDSLGLYHDVYALSDAHWLVSFCFLFVVLTAMAQLRKGLAMWPVGVLLIWLPMLTYLQLIPFTTWSLASERFVFMSVVGLSLLLAELISRLSFQRAKAVLLCCGVLCGGQVWLRIPDWEMSGPLRDHEFVRQSNFHNAIRDQIFSNLLPENRHKEARSLALNLRRDYAQDLVLAVIDLDEHAKLRVKAIAHTEALGEFEKVCLSFRRLDKALSNAHAAMRTETDISYNNLVTSIQRDMDMRYAAAKQECLPEVRQ